MMARHEPDIPLIVLIPGAWMGAWIWDGIIARLDEEGYEAMSLTLPGLEPGRPAEGVASIGLADHVDQVLDLIGHRSAESVVLVGHSYSGIVVGQVADQIPEVIHRSAHISSFLPMDGRALLDDWGPDNETRQAEIAQIHDDGMLWAPPPPDALQHESDLSDEHRRWLSTQFVAHPARTVLEPVRMSQPVTDQAITFISSASTGSDPLADLPPEFSDGVPKDWQLRTMNGGHWPMLADPETLISHLVEASSG